MPHGEKPKGKSWSFRNMLGRKRAKNGSSSPRSSKDPTAEAAEWASVKERVLAKLQEPLSNEKEPARHSVDNPRAPTFSPRLSYDGHEHFSQLKDAFAAAGQGYRDAQQPSRHSTSFWQFEREPVQSRSSSSAFQASPSASSSTSAASIANMRSTQQGFSSPASNVIARLMGLEELDAHDTSHIKFKHSLAAEASSSESSRGRQGPQSTRQGHTGTEDVHRNEPWKQERSPCLQPKHPRARGKSVEEVTRSPRQQRHVFLSHGCIPGNQEAEKRTPTREHRMERGKDPAQDFLDEMEEELKQCDKALERIEAVMQLKRRLLYMSRSAGGDELKVSSQDVERNFLDYTNKADLSTTHRGGAGHSPSSHMSHCNGRVQRDSIYSNGQHARAHSLDHRQRLLWEEEQSWDQMQQLPEDEYYSNTRGMRSKNAGTSGVGGHSQTLRDYRSRDMTNMESQSTRSLHQPQTHRRFLHRRSVSDGETPVFSLTEGAYNFEAAARACSTKAMGPSPIFSNCRLHPGHQVASNVQFCKDDSELHSDVPKTPEHKPQNRCRTPPSAASTQQCSGDKQKMTDLFQVEEACMLSRSRPQIQHKPVPEAMCEQPSPVSVLDNAQDDSPRSSEDYEDFKPAKSLDNGCIDEVGSACGDEIKRKSVARALWRTSAEEKPSQAEEEAKGRGSYLVFRPAVTDHAIKDEEVVKEMQQSWSGFSSEIAEVAVAVESMILKKLVEETIILYMMMMP